MTCIFAEILAYIFWLNFHDARGTDIPEKLFLKYCTPDFNLHLQFFFIFHRLESRIL